MMGLKEITFEEAEGHIEADKEVYFQPEKSDSLKKLSKPSYIILDVIISEIFGKGNLKYFLKGQFYLKRKDEEA